MNNFLNYIKKEIASLLQRQEERIFSMIISSSQQEECIQVLISQLRDGKKYFSIYSVQKELDFEGIPHYYLENAFKQLLVKVLNQEGYIIYGIQDYPPTYIVKKKQC